MNIGLIGMPNSGKTTIFNALTRSEAQVTSYANSKSEPNRAVVHVVDNRVEALSEMYRPRKTTFAAIELIDFVGLSQGAAREGLFTSSTMGLIKNRDALVLVLGNYQHNPIEKPAPVVELEKLEEELLISDLIIAENRLDRIAKAARQAKKTNLLDVEERLLFRITEQLGDNLPIRELKLDGEQEKMIRGFQFLTQKPVLVIINSDEENFGKNKNLVKEIEKRHRVIEFAGKFEMELSQLNDPEDIELFMEDIGIQESARDRLCRAAYELLGYISFFTVGSDEVRAWSIHTDESILTAAGTIHSDLARGFIRAECFSYDDLMAYGSEKQLSDRGLMRLEGKKYIVQDGDVVNIRFNI
ncbi:MAG: redox-regulated ATPase YchF [Deltaproteobacteria bacterium]|jgi:GTP-binding protein YchF|nr:redox-regulated ATPase YchF [Deltaproteobacteria bacterium]